MQVTFSNNQINKFQCWLSNAYEKITQIRWNLKRHCIQCHICGEVLDSRVIPYSPEQCGWKRLKDQWYKPWICHSCLEHRDFKPYIKMVDEQRI